MYIKGFRNRKFRLGMCYLNDDGSGEGGGAGAGNGSGNSATDKKPEGQEGGDKKEDLKFSQKDVDDVLTKRLAEEKAKHQKEIDDLKAEMQRKAELEKMSENDRTKAELEDLKKKYQEEQDKNALAIQTEKTRTELEEAKLPTSFLKFVLVAKDEAQTSLNIKELKEVYEAEIKKGIEAKIPSHNPGNNNKQVDNKPDGSPTYSGFKLQNSIAEYYNKE